MLDHNGAFACAFVPFVNAAEAFCQTAVQVQLQCWGIVLRTKINHHRERRVAESRQLKCLWVSAR